MTASSSITADSLALLRQAAATPLYTCPGETYPISQSVHLARLAAFYPKCRDCPARTETGNLPQETLEVLRSTERRVERPTLFEAEGARGVYLNELNRDSAARIAGAFARRLWDDAPLTAGTDQPQSPQTRLRRSEPLVVIGYDQRPSSPDIFAGVASMLGRMSCRVVDISLTTRPCFDFAVDHLAAAGGVFVTGSGCGPSWTGLDFVGRQAVPLSQGGELDAVAACFVAGYTRPTRSSAPRRAFQANVPYEAGLWKHFHALRPLEVCAATSERLTRELLARLFDKLPCRLEILDIPSRVRNVHDAGDPDVVRLAKRLRAIDADLGLLIDDDDRRCGFVDERGELVAAVDVSNLLAELARSESREATIVVESAAQGEMTMAATAGGDAQESLARTMLRTQAVLGVGTTGRYWSYETRPLCDAVVTLAKVLQVLSQSDQSFSQRVASRQST